MARPLPPPPDPAAPEQELEELERELERTHWQLELARRARSISGQRVPADWIRALTARKDALTQPRGPAQQQPGTWSGRR